MSNPICLYHRSDLDGKCSGYLVRRAIQDVELIGIDYGDQFPWEKVRRRVVYLVDFSLQPWSDMERLAECTELLVWIDHHKSAIEEYDKSGLHLDGKLRVGSAACELCWEHLFAKEDMPLAVKLLGRYDVWDLDYSTTVLPFQMAMRLDAWNPEDNGWDDLISDAKNVGRIAQDGFVILRYQKQRQNGSLMKKSFSHRWRNMTFLAVNAGGINSMAFESAFDASQHAAVMSYYFDGVNRKWNISLYSPNQSIDLSGVAKSMGGGGHPYACGFQIDKLSDIGL